MDWHEGFQIYAEHGSAIGKTFNPWYLRSSEVECFPYRDGQYHRALGADAHFYNFSLKDLPTRYSRECLNKVRLRTMDWQCSEP